MLRHANRLRPALIAAPYALTVLFSTAAVNGQSSHFRIPGSEENSSYSVTVQELRHEVPKAARAEMDKAEKASRKHKTDEEIEHLRKAIGIDPEYIAARNNLAVSLLITDTESAIAQLEEATKSDPHHPVVFYNLALGYLMLHQLDAAEKAARAAQSLGFVGPRGRILLGWTLISQQKYTAEALSLVKSTVEEFALAYMLTARVLIGQDRPDDAKSYIDAYLSTGDDEYRDYAARWLDYIAVEQRHSGREFARQTTPLPARSPGAKEQNR